MADEQYRWLDSDTAERLLSGESPDVVEPADRERAARLAHTLGSLTSAGPQDGAELPGEAAALAAFRKVRAERGFAGAPVGDAGEVGDGEGLVAGLPLRGGRAGPEPAEADGTAVEGRLGVVRLEGERHLGRVHEEPFRRARVRQQPPYLLGVVLREGVPFGGQDEPVGVGALLELVLGRREQRIGALAQVEPEDDRPAPARGQGHALDRRERDTSFAERREQLRRPHPPFVADEHGVGPELPGGMRTGQYITHAAHRMRDPHLRPLPARTAVPAVSTRVRPW